MKPVEPQLPLELSTPQPSDAAPKELRGKGDRFDALLAKAEQAVNKRGDASATSTDAPATNETIDRRGRATQDTRNIELPTQSRSIHSSITRNVRPVREQIPSELTNAAATASVANTATSAKQADSAPKASAKHGVDKTAASDGEEDPQALSAVLSQVATVVARIQVPQRASGDGQTAAVAATSARAVTPANDVSVTPTVAVGDTAATPGGVEAAATSGFDPAQVPTIAPRARTEGALSQTAAEAPAAKARAAGTRAGVDVASQTASNQASVNAPQAGAQSADQTRAPAQNAPAQPVAAPAQNAPAKAAPHAPERTALPALASAELTPVSPTPLAVNASALSASENTESPRKERASDKGKGGAVDDRIQGFTRGALGGPLAAYVARSAAASNGESDAAPSKHAEELDEQEDHDSKVQASNAFDVVAQVLPDPTLNPQAAPPPAEPARMQAPIPQPAAPAPMPSAPMVQVEFAARPEGAQNEAASISIHHPDLGPIQLEVHRDQGRVEVHAVIESHHAEAVLRANESGIRQGVQQSGMAFSALKVRVRSEDSSNARPAQQRRRRANDRE